SLLDSTFARRCRNIGLLAIDYAVWPRLRTRLTPGGRTWPGKPWVFGEEDSHLLYHYSCLHLHFCALQPSSRSTFNAHRTLLYRLFKEQTRSFGSSLSPVIFSAQVRSTSELLRFL